MRAQLARVLSLVAIAVCTTFSTGAQPYLQSWAQTYSGYIGDSLANAVAVDNAGNVFVTGKKNVAITGPFIYVYATIAYSSSGVPSWTNVFNGPATNNYGATAIAVDANGNVFVTGGSTTSLNYDYGTIAYSNNGVPLWTNYYAGPGDGIDIASAIAVDANGDVFVTGNSAGIGSRHNYATIEYSGSGMPLWTNRYNGPAGYDFARAIALDAQGNVFVTGDSEGSSGYQNYATVAYSNGGVPLWTNRYEGGHGQANAIAVDTNGNVFVTGYCTPNTNVPNHTLFVTLKYSPSGVPIWTNFYNGLGKTNDTATSIAVNSSGEVFVTGYSATSPFLPTRYYYTTIKYSSAGVPLWTNLYDGGIGNNEAEAVRLGPSGNVFVTGYAYGTDGYSYCTTIAYSTSGAGSWTNRFIGDYSSGAALAVDNQGNVDVAGYADASGEYLTIQYSAAQPIPLGIQQISNQIVLNWTNAGFLLQAAPSVTGVYTNISGAVSPYTNALEGSQQFFRLIAN